VAGILGECVAGFLKEMFRQVHQLWAEDDLTTPETVKGLLRRYRDEGAAPGEADDEECPERLRTTAGVAPAKGLRRQLPPALGVGRAAK
jgi:hypothetical protein